MDCGGLWWWCCSRGRLSVVGRDGVAVSRPFEDQHRKPASASEPETCARREPNSNFLRRHCPIAISCKPRNPLKPSPRINCCRIDVYRSLKSPISQCHLMLPGASHSRGRAGAGRYIKQREFALVRGSQDLPRCHWVLEGLASHRVREYG